MTALEIKDNLHKFVAWSFADRIDEPDWRRSWIKVTRGSKELRRPTDAGAVMTPMPSHPRPIDDLSGEFL